MSNHYKDLGIFSDLVEEARRQGPLFPDAPPGPETRARIRQVLGFTHLPEEPGDVRVERTWVKDGCYGEEVSWWVGYGPRTHAYLLKPEGATGRLPGIVALHDHGGFKYFGKEKIADGPDQNPPVIEEFRAAYYHRAYANVLAREGFVVLVPDTFMWGSRRFPFEEMPTEIQELARREGQPGEDEIILYNRATGFHEHLVSKYCNLLGTSMAGVVSHEDRIAVNYLSSRPDMIPERIGCLGLSGGGNRSALLLATHESIQAAVIVGLMSTYEGLLDHNIYTHTWMFFPFGWSRYGDWPDLAASRAPMPLLVQYDEDDDLFTMDGMQAAHAKIGSIYKTAGNAQAYQGQFYPGPHKFDLDMQAAAFAWFRRQLNV
jgi:dienelactone hydrolase